MKTETFYGNDADTFYVDRFGRVWIVASVDWYDDSFKPSLFGNTPNCLASTKTPVEEQDYSYYPDDEPELTDEIFELPESVKEEIIKQAKEDAQMFVDEFHEQLNPAKTDWDAVGFQSCNFSFHTKDQQTYDEAWDLYQSTLVEETGILSK